MRVELEISPIGATSLAVIVDKTHWTQAEQQGESPGRNR